MLPKTLAVVDAKNKNKLSDASVEAYLTEVLPEQRRTDTIALAALCQRISG
ncbi:MAG: hypothetical protein AAF590_04505 [Pseudomonadota bacterium]